MTNRWEKNLMQFNLLMNRKFLFHFVCVWLQIKKPVYFIIQLIFATIYKLHCTF